jgi:chromosome partitioning protein
VKRIQEGINRKLEVGGILFTMYDSRTRLANDVVQEVCGYFGKKVFKTSFPATYAFPSPLTFGTHQSLRSDLRGAKSYKKLAEEVLERV